MNEKEIGELRRRLRADKCAVQAIYGCLVNEKKEIVCNFRQPLTQVARDDADAVLQLMRKTLSGTVGKNLLTLPFSTAQVMDSEEHRLFSALRTEGTTGEEAIGRLFVETAEALQMEGPYLILLLQDKYDVPAAGKDGAEEESDTVFSYALCAVCPVKETKRSLGFFPSENALKSLTQNSVISPPELGFLFPSFDDRAANIYDITYYTKNSAANHPEFIENVAKTAAPMPADAQKDTFNGILEDTLSESCSMKVAVAVRDSLCEQIEEHKNANEEEPLTVSKSGVSRILRESGVEEPKIRTIESRLDENFGAAAAIPPQNLVNTRTIEVETPDVQIRVSPDRSDLLETRIIDGVHYILIRAENGVSVNGVTLHVE